ncbi:MAG: response regulator [Candidatus Omnitrophica bacterium]|nr:response regulator [Candidatus Omnitrophota bacterium]
MTRILIVDDDEKMRWLYRDILLSEGFDVLEAGSAESGLKMAIENIPDLILLDVMMPGKDGGQASADLSKNNRTKNIPIIFLTSIITEEEVKAHHGIVSGRPIIAKSTNRKEIIQRIKEILPAKGN